MSFGSRLKELRIQNNMTQRELAGRINVTRQAITKWENDNGTPKIETILALARLFKVSYSYMLTGDDRYSNEVALKKSIFSYYTPYLVFIALIFVTLYFMIFEMLYVPHNDFGYQLVGYYISFDEEYEVNSIEDFNNPAIYYDVSLLYHESLSGNISQLNGFTYEYKNNYIRFIDIPEGYDKAYFYNVYCDSISFKSSLNRALDLSEPRSIYQVDSNASYIIREYKPIDYIEIESVGLNNIVYEKSYLYTKNDIVYFNTEALNNSWFIGHLNPNANYIRLSYHYSDGNIEKRGYYNESKIHVYMNTSKRLPLEIEFRFGD